VARSEQSANRFGQNENSMSGKGKIARLPRGIRDQLNRRLDEGEAGTGLVRWLNALAE
jgi:hypothetical protein